MSLTLNSDTATPATLVFAAVIIVPEVLAAPVVKDVSPTLYEPLFLPVVLSRFKPLFTEAILFWSVWLEFSVKTVPVFEEAAPF